MKIGYARISTSKQTIDVQVDALTKAGCQKIFTDVVSGSKAERGGLKELFTFARAGDEIVVVRLDRLGRSLKDLLSLIEDIKEQSLRFVSLHENIDTNTSTGVLIFQMFGALAEFERNLIIERTKDGLTTARARGKKGGRPKSLSPEKIKLLSTMYADKSIPICDIAKTLKISRGTVYNYLARGKETQVR